ncbi:taste receptor, type 2, member 202 [Salminus brasiliensis]|uniref:taste receptor, type 2, member 202 n=1 Tax=Salminus brasiliensis TaxID=930266 RepID=UPI003B839A76
MLSPGHKIGIWLITGFLAILTVFFNVYILLVNLRNCRKKHLHLCPGDTIMTGISLASIGHQILSYFWMTMIEIDIQCMYDMTESILLVLVVSLKFSIMWATAFLTFFYSTKLVIKPIHCYTRIQEAILKHVLTVVIVIFFCGFTNCLPLLKVLTYQNSSAGSTDCGSITAEGIVGLGYVIYLVVIADIVPGILMIKCSISISYHLAIHLRHMKESTNGTHAPKLGTQMRVIRMNLTLVAVFLCFLFVDLYTQSRVMLQSENTMGLTILFSTVYTTVSGFVLIYGKKSFWKEFIQWYSLFLEKYPCLNWLKIPESKNTKHSVHKH